MVSGTGGKFDFVRGQLQNPTDIMVLQINLPCIQYTVNYRVMHQMSLLLDLGEQVVLCAFLCVSQQGKFAVRGNTVNAFNRSG